MEMATKSPQGVRPADKVLQALSSLAALIDITIREVKSLDSEFQNRLLQAVHDTEASLQSQTAEHVERARQEVQEQLNGKFQNDLQDALSGLKSEFETERGRFKSEVEKVKADSVAEIEKARQELKNAVHKTEVLLQAESTESIERARQEVQEQLKVKYQNDLQSALNGLKAEFETERGRFNSEKSDLIAQIEKVKADSATEGEKAREELKKTVHQTELSLQAKTAESIERVRQEVQDELNSKYRKDLQAALDGLKSEFETERDRLNKELLHTVEAASKLEAERSGLISEIDKVKADSAAEIAKAREEARTAAAEQPASSAASAPPASLQQEIARTEVKLQEILKLIDNPATELSKVIRMNVEKSELEAYLKGIRLVLNSKN
jgi:hypothetical protein